MRRLERLPENIGALRELEYFYADTNRLTPEGLPRSLPQLSKLRTLWLQDNPDLKKRLLPDWFVDQMRGLQLFHRRLEMRLE
eukprot:SAG31_NODE_4033_length_3648_cov_1.803043_4_plen_82_part_00